jgi:hypothetical protein
MSKQRYFLSIDDLSKARGDMADLSFSGSSADAFAQSLQSALRNPDLWQRWRSAQADPDAVDPGTGATDPQATVSAKQSDLHTEIEVVSVLPHAILKHRLTLLAGRAWRLHDVRAA